MFNISCVERMVITISIEQKPKEIILRSKHNGYFHVSNINDSVLNSVKTEKYNWKECNHDNEFRSVFSKDVSTSSLTLPQAYQYFQKYFHALSLPDKCYTVQKVELDLLSEVLTENIRKYLCRNSHKISIPSYTYPHVPYSILHEIFVEYTSLDNNK